MHAFELVPLGRRDHAAARALVLEGLRERWGSLDAALNPDLHDVLATYAAGCFVVGKIANVVVAAGGFLPVSETTVQVHRMSVARTHRGRGLGTRILAHLLDEARRRGFRRAILETTDDWADAIAFYEARGFRAFDHHDGDIYFEHSLAPPGNAASSTTVVPPMPLDDDTLLERFEAAAISRAAWTHRAHVRMAYLYLRDLPFGAALAKIRRGIKSLNRANAVPETATSGYHETLTVAWARLIVAATRQSPVPTTSEELLERYPELLDKTALRAHYSRERILSPEAKRAFVEPDLAPLPVAE